MADIRNRDLAKSMQLMAWEKAKGELKAMLHFNWTEYDHNGNQLPSDFEAMNERVESFISSLESHHF